ncbi:MAG: hypothetical protein R3F11_25855 [Verrucomicrobiales bacterium]
MAQPGAKSASGERRTIDASAEETAAPAAPIWTMTATSMYSPPFPAKARLSGGSKFARARTPPTGNGRAGRWRLDSCPARGQCEAADADRDGDLDLIASGDGLGITLSPTPG